MLLTEPDLLRLVLTSVAIATHGCCSSTDQMRVSHTMMVSMVHPRTAAETLPQYIPVSPNSPRSAVSSHPSERLGNPFLSSTHVGLNCVFPNYDLTRKSLFASLQPARNAWYTEAALQTNPHPVTSTVGKHLCGNATCFSSLCFPAHALARMYTKFTGPYDLRDVTVASAEERHAVSYTPFQAIHRMPSDSIKVFQVLLLKVRASAHYH